jgi:hypothetical protein
MEEKIKELKESMTILELIDYVDEKFKHYRELGYGVSHFISTSYIDLGDNKSIHNKMSNHELKTIIQMDEYLKNKED